MTNISISEQVPGYQGRMMDGETVCVRYRDPDGNRQMDFYTVRAEVYVDLRNLSERYSWKDGQRISNPPSCPHS